MSNLRYQEYTLTTAPGSKLQTLMDLEQGIPVFAARFLDLNVGEARGTTEAAAKAALAEKLRALAAEVEALP